MNKGLEIYNIINFLKIIDISLLNLFDYIDFENKSLITNDKFIINFDNKIKNIFESLLIGNINNNINYGKINIIVNTCNPKENWRNLEQNINNNSFKYIITDKTVHVDQLRFNVFLDNFFKKNEKLNLNNNFYNNSKKLQISKNIKFMSFESIDVYDIFIIIDSILSNFGIVNKDNFNYNIINDGNHVFLHGSSFVDNLVDKVRLSLINKGVI